MLEKGIVKILRNNLTLELNNKILRTKIRTQIRNSKIGIIKRKVRIIVKTILRKKVRIIVKQILICYTEL